MPDHTKLMGIASDSEPEEKPEKYSNMDMI